MLCFVLLAFFPPSVRPHLSVVMPQDSQASLGMPSTGSLVLPSFISLSSSPEEADAPDTLPTDAVQVKGISINNKTQRAMVT